MKIGIVNIPGMDVGLVQILREHFHNSAEIVDLGNTEQWKYDLVMVPPSTLYSDSEELKRRIEQSSLYTSLSEYSDQGTPKVV